MSLTAGSHVQSEARRIYDCFLEGTRSDLEVHKSHILLELAKGRDTLAEFQYRAKKLLYHIEIHPETKSQYTKCYEYLYRLCTERKPDEMTYEEWCRARITEKKVLSYLREILKRQNLSPERDVTTLVKRNCHLAYKGCSAKVRRQMGHDLGVKTPIYQAALENSPEHYPGCARLLRGKRRDYENQSKQFADIKEDPNTAR